MRFFSFMKKYLGLGPKHFAAQGEVVSFDKLTPQMKGFLSTFTAFTQTGQEGTIGINQGSVAFVKVVIPSTMANTDTLDITVPPGQDPGLVPVGGLLAATFSANVWTFLTTLTLTTHNVSTGVTRATASGAAAANGEIWLVYANVA